MPMQQQPMSSFAKRLGGQVSAANAEHKDKPVDTGNRRLPAGIRNGIAKLSTMYTKAQTEKSGMVPEGEVFFRASAIVVSPEVHDGEKVAGGITQVLVPLCAIPAKGQRKASSFSDNWFDFQNVFKLLGVNPPAETPQTDPTGARTEAYYFAAMKTLCDPTKPPIYLSFSTRGWTPPVTAQQPKPAEMVFETWHGLATPEQVAAMNGQFDPGAGVTDHGPPPTQAATPLVTTLPTMQVPTSAPGTPHPSAPLTEPTVEDEVDGLVEVAMDDVEGATPEGAAASARLEELAWAAGWTKEQTAAAADWLAVADMVLNAPPGATLPTSQVPTPLVSPNGVPTVGSKWRFAKRTKDGSKLKNNQGVEFPPQEVEVTTVDTAQKFCTLKTLRDGKDVVDIRTKQPVAVKWEWLESIPY